MKLTFLILFLIGGLGIHADNFYWRGTTAEFNSANNWISGETAATAGPTAYYPGANDNAYFDADAPVKALVSTVVNVKDIICTADVPYTLATTTLNVYGDILLNGNLTFIGPVATSYSKINMLGATQNTLDLGGVTHPLYLVIDKPGGGVTSINDISLLTPEMNQGLEFLNGDFKISGHDITVPSIHFRPTMTIPARMITLENCTLTTGHS